MLSSLNLIFFYCNFNIKTKHTKLIKLFLNNQQFKINKPQLISKKKKIFFLLYKDLVFFIKLYNLNNCIFYYQNKFILLKTLLRMKKNSILILINDFTQCI